MIHITSQDFDIAKIADSGQCFRLRRIAPDAYRLIALNRALKISTSETGHTLHCSPEEFETVWRAYFDLGVDYSLFRNAAPAQDRFLTEAVHYGQGIRILRQDPWEMLITFILSQQKSIPAIAKSVECLCSLYGSPISFEGETHFTFPTPERIAALSPEDLRACGLGYRDKYVYQAAQMVASGALRLADLRALDDEALMQALLSVYGVGKKVANCVMLFGFYRLSGFPLDTWMNRIIKSEYRGKFPLARYAGYEGVIQQYIFYYARSAAYQSFGGAHNA